MYQILVGFLTSPSCSCVHTLPSSSNRSVSHQRNCSVEPRLCPSTTSNIPSKANCCQYQPFFPFHHQHYICSLAFLWFSKRGISSSSQQCVHRVQVGRICHGDINTHLLPFLSGSVRQLPSRNWPLSLPDKSVTCRKAGYPNIEGQRMLFSCRRTWKNNVHEAYNERFFYILE